MGLVTRQPLLHMNNKGADQPAHLCSLINAFVIQLSNEKHLNLLHVNFLDSRFYLVYVVQQTGFLVSRPILLPSVKVPNFQNPEL